MKRYYTTALFVGSEIPSDIILHVTEQTTNIHLPYRTRKKNLLFHRARDALGHLFNSNLTCE